MRGKLTPFTCTFTFARITPADAGKTYSQFPLFVSVKDHPRGCGENLLLMTVGTNTVGSPPRMRGKQCKRPKNAENYRITPADAGKTYFTAIHRHLSGDHPRGCGENCFGIGGLIVGRGSPPRMRGKPRHCMYMLTGFRITPADAGKTHCGRLL